LSWDWTKNKGLRF